MLQPPFYRYLLTHSTAANAQDTSTDLLLVEARKSFLGSLGLCSAHLEDILPQEQPAFPKPQQFAQDFQGFSCFCVSLTLVTTFCPKKVQYFSTVLRRPGTGHHPHFNISLTDIPGSDKKCPSMFQTNYLFLLVQIHQFHVTLLTPRCCKAKSQPCT